MGTLFIFLFILYFLFLFCQLRPNTMCYWLFASFFLPFFYCNSILTILSLRSLKIFKKILYTSITDLLHKPRKVIFYTVCQRYGIETSDYSFGYIAGWSSDKETKELKGSLETIRKTAAEMITGIDEKLKERLAVKEQEAPTPLRDAAIPVYREAAMYAFEAGELDAYRTSMQANMDCKEAIEQTINDYYGNNRLAAESAVKSILEKFSPERTWWLGHYCRNVRCQLQRLVQIFQDSGIC